MDENTEAVAVTVTTMDETANSPLNEQNASGDVAGLSTAVDSLITRVGDFCSQHCGEDFKEEASYVEHCHQLPSEKVSLENQLDGSHDAERDRETTNICTLCSLSFDELSELHLHMEKNHGQTSPKESGIQKNSGIAKRRCYECPDCGKSYYMIGHFLNHQRSHTQAAKSVFNDLEHLKKKSFQCEFCGRNYSRASALDAHRRYHQENLVVKSRNRNSGDTIPTEEMIAEAKPREGQTDNSPEKPFECKCGKSFSALLGLKTHQRFSRNSQCSPDAPIDKPKKISTKFYCSECKKDFGGYLALFNHQRWHSNHSQTADKKFQCEECGKAFVSSTFYFRHKRIKHSHETPAKSFLHQVCQLQKKAFQCKDCGLKFSRASALHSHQLHHTDVYGDGERKEMANEEVKLESRWLIASCPKEEEPLVHEADEDVESYEPGDFNVQVISASESDDESIHDPNPDLELLCESDQEMRDDGDPDASPSSLVVKPEMDLKIVQVDFEQADEQDALLDNEGKKKTTEQRFNCPECYRWFTSSGSLGIHRMWHRIRRKRQSQAQSAAVGTSDTGGHDGSSSTVAPHSSHTQQHETHNPSDDVLNQAEELEKKNLTCGECGQSFSHLSALVSHQLHHPKRKKFQCPDCMMSYLHAASLFNHMKKCSAQKKDNVSVTKKEYNPKKTLLGPKIYHCEQCGKGFWSLGAYSHHKQNHKECAELRQRKGGGGSLHSVNGQPRSTVKVACPVCGRKFRHKGIMTLHMRKHENGNHKCELCHRSFRLFSSLLRHQVVHNDQLLPPPIKSFQHQVEQLKKNTYSCPDCGKLFSRAKALQFHMKSHGYETGHSPSSPGASVILEDLQCATCLSHFNNKTSLRAHKKLCIRRVNQTVDSKTQPLENDTPLLHKESVGTRNFDHLSLSTEGKEEMNSSELKMEDQSHNLKYKCNKCDKSFSVVGALNLHKRIHAERYRLAKAKLAMSVMLKKPNQEELGKGPFHCSECGRRFMSNSALGSHKRWHKGKKFSRSMLKDDDFKSRTDSGAFHCNTCSKQFFNHCVLQRHQMFNPRCQIKTELGLSKHAGSSRTVENSDFSCPKCNKTFVQGLLLAVHCENEHGIIWGAADCKGDGLVLGEHVNVSLNGSESTSLGLKKNVHQCSLCSKTFANERSLDAHIRQAHSESTKGQNIVPLIPKSQIIPTSSEVRSTEAMSAVDYSTKKYSLVSKETKMIESAAQSVSCLDCGTQCSTTRSIFDHKNVCMPAKQESKQEIQAPEGTTDVSPSLNRFSEHSIKCFYKCDMCGKAFQTEEHLRTHKTKAKSRPYCCTLCCHGFWTETQLQQHLAWHDEVRGRLPNEVRYRLSAAMTTKPLKPKVPSADNRGKFFPSTTLNQAMLKPDSQLQSSHKCQHCGKAFLSPTALQKHETQHCNNDSYHCSICPRTFSEIQDLIDHHQECIGDYNAEQYNIACKDCGQIFTYWEEFQSHRHEHSLEEESEVPAFLPRKEDNGVSSDEDMDGVAGGSDASSSLKTKYPHLIPGAEESQMNLKQVYGCAICGKLYTYLVSFKKHQKLHENENPDGRRQSPLKMHKYECPDCGMSFVRQTRLLSHLRVHMPHRPLKPMHTSDDLIRPRCNTCNTDFSSIKSWMIHVDLHKEKPLWCLSCAKGFRDEGSLDKHLQSHSLRQHKCDICLKSFQLSSQLKNHFNTHTGAKPYECTLCGKMFSHSGNIIAHQKHHLKLYVGSTSVPVGFKKSMLIRDIGVIEKETPKLTSVTKEPHMHAVMEEMPEKTQTSQLCDGAESGDQSNCEDLNRVESAHHLAELGPTDESKSETERPQTELEQEESETKETNVYKEQKYWEWECFECDMGFDDVEKLHLHYIKHATGELPFPQFDVDG